MSKDFFEAIQDALIGFLPPSLRPDGAAVTSANLKVWFGDETREHYEVQLISRSGRKTLEIGFHSEHRDEQRNERAVQVIAGSRRRWSKSVRDEAEVGAFIGHQKSWRRISETWSGRNLVTEESAIEAADRLATYIKSFEPIRVDGLRATRE